MNIIKKEKLASTLLQTATKKQTQEQGGIRKEKYSLRLHRIQKNSALMSQFFLQNGNLRSSFDDMTARAAKMRQRSPQPSCAQDDDD
jgi:hypothetical protein